MNKEQAAKCLQIENDFLCTNPSWFNCLKCDYYYNAEYPRCIKRDIKTWALYHAEKEESEAKDGENNN